MPRKSSLLPYLQVNRVGRLSYVRRVPQHLRQFVGNRSVIRRTLGVTSTDCTTAGVIKAWTAVNAEVEALLTGAKAEKAGALGRKPEVTTLSPRDTAAIAAEPWRQLLNAGDNGEITPGMEQMLAEVVLMALQVASQAGQQGDIEQLKQGKAAITQRLLAETLNKLQIQPDLQAMEQIQQRLLGYVPMLGADLQKREAGDFSPGHIESKPPPLPKRKVTWEQLVEQYRLSVGGTIETVGQGVTEGRVQDYEVAIKEIIQSTGKSFPDELTTDHIRDYVNDLMGGTLAVKTQQKKLTIINNLYKIGVQYGLLTFNPVQDIKIKRPKGSKQNTYRSFTKEELVRIFKLMRQVSNVHRQWVAEALLCSGGRSAEIVCLRHSDIRKTKAGVYFFHFKHDPQGKHPTSLKGGADTERMTPLHQRLIDRGFVKQLVNNSEGYITPYSTLTSGWTHWFSDQLLKPLGIYVKGETGLHSLRNTAIDLWREAGVDQEFRRAFVAHAAVDVQDKVYGQGLKNMPDVLNKEMKKVDLDWLP